MLMQDEFKNVEIETFFITQNMSNEQYEDN